VLFMIDDSYSIFRHWYGVDLAMAPSEYAWKHFTFGIVRDPLALRMRDLLRLDHIMWGSDFPHSVSSYPESRRWLDDIFSGCTPEQRRQVLVDNPVRFFGLDPGRELTPTPSAT
jgi:predicted TIM-barrel fold metal-dependent hydrolase